MARLRLNQEYRNKIANKLRVHLEQENTQEKDKYLQARESLKPLQDKTWQLATEIVRRHYTPEDVEMARHLQNKFENVSTIAKDSCFHFYYDGVDSDGEPTQITKHFDFKLNGRVDGTDNGRYNRASSDSRHEFAYAYYRDELKGQEGCNPDINIEMENKDQNPHWTKMSDANNKYLGFTKYDNTKDNLTSHARQWDKDFEIDLIGRDYCRDRAIACSKREYDILIAWQSAKGQLIQCHYAWIKSVLNQVKEIKLGLKGYKYLDEAIELSNELGCPITDAEIIRVNSSGLTIYNPKNLASRIKGMKNKHVSREDKIAIWKKEMAERGQI